MRDVLAEKKKTKTKKHTTKKVLKTDSKKNKLDIELAELKDKHIRLKAEFENFRKRKNKEISSLLQYDGENLIKDILPIFDDIDRMLDSAGRVKKKDESTLIDGMQIVQNFLP